MRAATRTQAKRLPAFGREILELRRRGLRPRGGIILAIDSWNYGIGTSRARAVITPDLDPAALDYSFVAGLDVELVWLPKLTPKERLDATIRAVLRCAPQRLLVWNMGEQAGVKVIKSKEVGIELAEYA